MEHLPTDQELIDQAEKLALQNMAGAFFEDGLSADLHGLTNAQSYASGFEDGSTTATLEALRIHRSDLAVHEDMLGLVRLQALPMPNTIKMLENRITDLRSRLGINP